MAFFRPFDLDHLGAQARAVRDDDLGAGHFLALGLAGEFLVGGRSGPFAWTGGPWRLAGSSRVRVRASSGGPCLRLASCSRRLAFCSSQAE